MRRLPDVIYIGLQKTGSTFLRHYFWNHDEVYCDRHGIFFQTDRADVNARGAEAVRSEYLALFPERAPRPCHIDMYEALGMGYVFRDRSTWDGKLFIDPEGSLITGPARAEPETLADRIHAVVPSAKILITIRNQIGWLDSSYRHFLEHLPRNRRHFVDFLATPEGKISLDAGHFDRIVDLYDRRFGAANVHVLPLELLERTETECLTALAAFLKIQPIPYAAEKKNLNRGPAISIEAATGGEPSIAKRLVRKIRPRPDELVPPDIVSALRSTFAAGNARLGKRIGIELEQLGYPV